MKTIAAPGIGHGAQGGGQGAQGLESDGQRGSFAGGFAGGVFGGQFRGAEALARIVAQGLDPQLFGPVVSDVKFDPLPAVPISEAQRRPARGFITGAGVAFRVGEGFRE